MPLAHSEVHSQTFRSTRSPSLRLTSEATAFSMGTFPALPSLRPLLSPWHCLTPRAWWHDFYFFPQEEQGTFCKTISLRGYGREIFVSCTARIAFVCVKIKIKLPWTTLIDYFFFFAKQILHFKAR